MEQTPTTLARMGKATLLGLGAALLCTLLFALLFSALFTLGLPKGILPLFTHLTVFFSAVAGGILSGLCGNKNGLIFGLCLGAAFGIVHCLATVLFGALSASFLTYLSIEILGGVAGGVWGVNLRKTQ